MTRESSIECYLDAQVKAAGGLTRKTVSPGRKGFPDRFVALGWFVGLVETKAPRKTPRPDQAREHARLRKAGVPVRVISTRTQVRAFIDQCIDTRCFP